MPARLISTVVLSLSPLMFAQDMVVSLDALLAGSSEDTVSEDIKRKFGQES